MENTSLQFKFEVKKKKIVILQVPIPELAEQKQTSAQQ